MPTSVLHSGGATGSPKKIQSGNRRIAGILVTPVSGAIRVSGADVTASLGQPIAVGERADLAPADWHYASQSGSAVTVMVTEYEVTE